MRDIKLQEHIGASSVALRILLAVAGCLIVASTGPADACCQLGGTACGDPFAISCNDGVVCFVPWRNCPGCKCTTTSAGHTCLSANAEPGTVVTLVMDKTAPGSGDINLSWGASCSASGPDYAVDEGQLGVWFSHAPLRCSTAHTLFATVTPSGGNRYYLIAPVAGDFTGSLGTDSTGAERPDASPSCTDDRALVPCP